MKSNGRSNITAKKPKMCMAKALFFTAMLRESGCHKSIAKEQTKKESLVSKTAFFTIANCSKNQ